MYPLKKKEKYHSKLWSKRGFHLKIIDPKLLELKRTLETIWSGSKGSPVPSFSTLPLSHSQHPDYHQVQSSLPQESCSFRCCTPRSPVPSPPTWTTAKHRWSRAQQTPAHHSTSCPFGMICKLRIIFTFILMIIKKNQRNNISWDVKFCEIQILVSINKVLLRHHHAHSCLCMLLLCNSRIV